MMIMLTGGLNPIYINLFMEKGCSVVVLNLRILHVGHNLTMLCIKDHDNMDPTNGCEEAGMMYRIASEASLPHQTLVDVAVGLMASMDPVSTSKFSYSTASTLSLLNTGRTPLLSSKILVFLRYQEKIFFIAGSNIVMASQYARSTSRSTGTDSQGSLGSLWYS